MKGEKTVMDNLAPSEVAQDNWVRHSAKFIELVFVWCIVARIARAGRRTVRDCAAAVLARDGRLLCVSARLDEFGHESADGVRARRAACRGDGRADLRRKSCRAGERRAHDLGESVSVTLLIEAREAEGDLLRLDARRDVVRLRDHPMLPMRDIPALGDDGLLAVDVHDLLTVVLNGDRAASGESRGRESDDDDVSHVVPPFGD